MSWDSARGRTADNEPSAAGRLLIGPTQWYRAYGYCPVFAATLPITTDGVHLTASYSEHPAPVILQAFREAGALPAP
jgi:hypothetical protein